MGCGSSFSALPSIIINKNKLPSITPRKNLQKQNRLENLEPFTLICLDDNEQDFRSVIDYFCYFNNLEECEEFILNNNNNNNNTYDYLFFIVSDQYAPNIVSHIHDLTQIIFIYILEDKISNNKRNIIDNKWTKRYSKVKGIYFDHKILLEELLSDVKFYTNIGDLLPITIYSRLDNFQQNNSSTDHLRFLFYQLFLHEYCLNSSLSLNKINLIDIIEDYYSYSNLNEIKQFNHEYNSTIKIIFKYFLKDLFIRKLLTKSLLKLNLKILFTLRFFIKDMHKTMIEIYSSSSSNKSRSSNEQIFYRSQILSEKTFTRIKSNIGELLSINNFFLTNKNRHDSLLYIRQYIPSNNSIYRILFEFKIPEDYKFHKQRPFVDISHYTSDKNTILFFIGSIFRINTSVFDMNNDCWIIQLTLYDERINDDFSQVFTFVNDNNNSITFANLLRQISPNSAEHFYKHILKENSELFSKFECYRGLGLCSYLSEDYEKALIYFEKALEMKPNDQLIKSSLHNSIGLVYAQQDDIDQAHLHFSQALKNSSLPLHQACAHHNLALISSKQGLYDEELDHYQQAFQIRTDQLPSNHLQLASLFNNIGIAYSDMQQYDKALLNLRKSLEIRLKLLSENHIDVARSYTNIGTVYARTEEFHMTLDYFNKAQILFEKLQPLPEQDIKQLNKNIKIVNDKLRRKTY